MIAYPLESISLEKAQEFQFRWIDTIMQHFSGYELLTQGDLGVHKAGNIPQTTRQVEKVIAQFFNCEEAVLVRKSGTGAIFEALSSLFKLKQSRNVFVHTAPIYSTTQTSFEQLNATTICADFNDLDTLEQTIQRHSETKIALVQYTRQQLSDSYDIGKVISLFKRYGVAVVTDDNYAVMKVEHIGSQLGADVSCFSLFKLLGPQGVGCVVGSKAVIDVIRNYHYSGGSQVQGFEALKALRGLVYAPVALAISAQQSEKIKDCLNQGLIEEIKQAVIVNAQSKVVLVEFKYPIAKEVLVEAEKLGALPHPVGSESEYEFVPLFYKVSGTMLQGDPELANYWIRINPMRCGCDTILRVLQQAIKKVI